MQWLWSTVDTAGEIVGVIALLLVNTLGVAMVALQLPGTWIILLGSAAYGWWRWDEDVTSIRWFTLAILLGLAIVGELIETLAGAAGARRAGGTRTGAVLAIFGGVLGAIVGTMVIPIPVFGTIVGACLGAAVATMLGDRWRGRSWSNSRLSARGAAVGKFWGTLGKLAVAVTMWIVVAIALMV